MNKKLAKIVRCQRGLTLNELVIAVAITALIMGGIGTAVYQIIVVNAKSNAHMTAVKDVENAVHWLTRDAQMAQYSEDASPLSTRSFPINLTWTNPYESISGNVTYQISGKKLLRVFSDNGTAAVTSVIAHNIDSANTDWSFSGAWSGAVLRFNVTSKVTGFREASETRRFDIVTRAAIPGT